MRKEIIFAAMVLLLGGLGAGAELKVITYDSSSGDRLDTDICISGQGCGRNMDSYTFQGLEKNQGYTVEVSEEGYESRERYVYLDLDSESAQIELSPTSDDDDSSSSGEGELKVITYYDGERAEVDRVCISGRTCGYNTDSHIFDNLPKGQGYYVNIYDETYRDRTNEYVYLELNEETRTFELERRSDSDDDPGTYSFDITFENSVNEGIENARVRVSGNSYDRTDHTDSRGEATFYNLVEGRNYDVEITCSTQGFNEIDVIGSITINDRPSFNEKTFSFPTQSDYCADSDTRDDDDDQDDIGNDLPIARLDVSTVSSGSGYERLKFDASDSEDDDGRITKYEFDLDGDDFYDDRTIYSGGVVYKTFRSDFYDEVGVRVTDNDGGKDTTREDIYVNVEDEEDDFDERPEIDLFEPRDGETGVRLRPTFEWRIDDDERQMNYVTLYVKRGGSDVFDNPDFTRRLDTSVGDSNYFTLDRELLEDRRYYWGIRFEDDDYSARESPVFDFRTREDDDFEEEDGSLEVTVRDDEGDRMDNARVEIRNGDFDSKRTSNGVANFYDLEPDTYEVKVFCEGRESEKDVRVSSGEDEETDIYLGFSSSDDYCGEDDDEGDGRLTVNVEDDRGEDLDALVRVDGRERYTGNDGRVVFDDLPRENFQVRVSKSGYETEYRNVDLEDDRSQTITVRLERREEDERPEAEFDYSPLSPEVDERISFDGGLSTGDIVDYQWNFGDGDRSAGRQVTHRYGESGTYPVSLTVEEDDGDQDTRIKYVSVGSAQEECGISEDSFFFSLDDYTIEEGDSTDAELQIFNTGSEDQNVDVEIKVDGGTVRDRTVNVPAGSSRTVTARVSPERDSFVTAEMSTSGGSCGFKDFDSLTRELIVLQEADEEEASLDVVVDSEDGYVRNARVEVEGPEDRVRYTDRYGEAGFSLEAGRYDVEVSHPRYETEDDSIRLREGDREELRFDLDREDEDDEDGTLEVNVIDGEGDDIDDARVRVENGDRRTEYTDSRGEARFSLEADDYDIEVTHPDYDDTARSSVEIEEDEFHSRTIRLYEERDRRGLEIVSTDYPSNVCRGDTLSVDYRVRNYHSYDESAQTTASGFGSNIITNTYVVDSGESVSGTLRFTNVEGSGQEEFEIRVENGTSDTVYRDVEVENCGTDDPQEPTDAASVSMKLSYPISPNRALVGDTVKVSGFVDGVDRRTQVRIDVDGDEKARVSTQPDGYYQTYIRVDSPGMKTVRARAAGESASRQIEVLPTATVSSIEAPRSVFEGESFEVCGQVNSQIQAGVFFYEDGRLIERENTRGETCFEVTAEEPGTHSYEVRAATPGTSSSSTVSVEVMETEVQARSFPDQIASVESGSGMVKVDLYNSNSEMTRYDLNLEGLPSTWLSQSSKQVILSPGESETVYFYLTPRDEGSYEPEIVVEADNSEVYRQEVDLETGGQNEPREKSFLEALRGFFP